MGIGFTPTRQLYFISALISNIIDVIVTMDGMVNQCSELLADSQQFHPTLTFLGFILTNGYYLSATLSYGTDSSTLLMEGALLH